MASSTFSDRLEGVPVLVTGAGGFIGSWLAEGLLERGARVIAPVRDFNPHSRFWEDGIGERCEVVDAGLLDYETLLATLREHRVAALFHLAAQPIVGAAKKAPQSTFESNVRGTATLLEACRVAREEGVPLERIVVASSDHAYGTHEEMPFREDYALRPLFPYDVSKGCTDVIARSYASAYGMPVAATRMANTYGGGDRHWSRIVPDSARALLRGERPVIRSDGTPERDYMYVEDAVTAYLAIAGSLDDPAMHGRAWNAGLETPVPVLELVNTLIAVSGRELTADVRGEGKVEGEIDREYVDSTAIRTELGWAPKWTLTDGLRATYEWYANHLAAEAVT